MKKETTNLYRKQNTKQNIQQKKTNPTKLQIDIVQLAEEMTEVENIY